MKRKKASDRDLLAVLEQLDQIAALWQDEELFFFFLSDRTQDLEELTRPFSRSMARIAHLLGIRTNTSVFRDVAGRSLLRLDPLINAASPKKKQWQMESLEALSPKERAAYQQLLALPLSLLSGAHEALPQVALPLDRAVMIRELLLDVQRALSSTH